MTELNGNVGHVNWEKTFMYLLPIDISLINSAYSYPIIPSGDKSKSSSISDIVI